MKILFSEDGYDIIMYENLIQKEWKMKEQQSAMIQVRVEEALKRDAMRVLDKIGIDMPTAIRVFLKRIVAEDGIPFNINLPKDGKKTGGVVTFIPAKPAKRLRYGEFLDLVAKVPRGFITRYDDICEYLCRKYAAERVEFIHGTEDWKRSREVPFWRVVSTRGVLSDSKWMSRELQQEWLKRDGLTIVPCGVNNRSLMVKDYKLYLFDFDSIEERQ